MSDISREVVKCAKCGKESPQMIVYSVNYLLGDKESNDKLIEHKQKCPYCEYEAIDISVLNDKLERKTLEKITEDFISEMNKYEIFKIPNELYLDYFEKLEKLLNSNTLEEDDRFVTYGRLDFLKQELPQRLKDENLKYEDLKSVWGKNKWDNRLGAFWDLYDYIKGDRYISPAHVPEGKSFKDILLANDQYYKDGFICKQESDILLEMINEIKSFIKNNQSSSEIKNDNKSKKLILKIVDNDWGLKTIYTWSTKTWCIYSDLSVDYEVRNGEDKTKSYSHNINEEELKQIIKNIDLAKPYNREVQACDGEAWEFVQYENDNIVWERKLGYIYGIEPLETICDMLRNLVKDDSDVFIADEMEENDMGLFSKKDKYDIDAKDNTPQFVYGIPDSLRKKWAKEDEEKNKKYDIDPEDNIPQKVYGVPFFVNKNTKKCPYCNSTELWKYLYGEPTHDYDKDKYVLGGCEITGNQPTYKCKKCGKDIYPDNNFVMPKITTKKSIRIGIKNDKSNYVMLLNHYREDNTYDIAFADLNNLSGKTISDLSTRIPEMYFVTFIDRLYTIIKNWQNNYSGENKITWSINIEEDGNNKVIFGNGGLPEEWDDLINLLIEYEKIFKNAKKIEIDKIQDMEYNRLTLKEAISQKVEDPFWVETIIKYFKEDAKVNDEVAKILFKDLSKYDDILNEFTKYLNQKTYDLENAIEINGYTAKKIHELNPSFEPTGVYTFMELLRTDPKRAEEIIKGGFKNKDAIPPTKNIQFPNPFDEI
mgnify:FL=1